MGKPIKISILLWPVAGAALGIILRAFAINIPNINIFDGAAFEMFLNWFAVPCFLVAMTYILVKKTNCSMLLLLALNTLVMFTCMGVHILGMIGWADIYGYVIEKWGAFDFANLSEFITHRIELFNDWTNSVVKIDAMVYVLGLISEIIIMRVHVRRKKKSHVYGGGKLVFQEDDFWETVTLDESERW